MNRRIAIVTILTALCLALPAAAASTVISLGNGVLEVSAGQTASLPVSVADVQDLYGVEIHLQFDPAVVQVADADANTDGVQVVSGGFLSADFVAQNRADNQAGTIDYAATQINPSEPKRGSGTLLTIQFQGVGAGRTSELEVIDQILSTLDGEIIPATVVSGEIRVDGSATSAGTATPSPQPGSPTIAPSASPTTPPSATATAASSTREDAPTATRAFTNTPVPAAPDATAPSATPGQAAGAPPATRTGQAVGATATRTPQALATEAPAAGGVTVAPSPFVADAPASGSTPEAAQPTPVLVAKAPSGNTGKAILEPGVREKAGAGEQQQGQSKQPAFSGLLIAAGVLLGLAVVAGAVVFWLSLRRRRA